MPLGAVQLIIHLDGDAQRVTTQRHPAEEEIFRESLVHGPSADWFLVRPGRRFARIGVQFAPGGAYPFFALPTQALRDQHVPLEALWGAHASEVADRLRDAPTPQARFLLLERLLLMRAVHPLKRHPAVDYALRRLRPSGSEAGPISIAQLVDDVGMSHRRFIELFRTEVGLAPNEHRRLRRFLAVARQARKAPAVSWVDHALQMGYADQAHLVRDFHAFSGLSPRAYLRRAHPRFWTYIALTGDAAAAVSS